MDRPPGLGRWVPGLALAGGVARFGFVSEHRFFPTIGVAVAAYLEETGVDWLDWEEYASLPER